MNIIFWNIIKYVSIHTIDDNTMDNKNIQDLLEKNIQFCEETCELGLKDCLLLVPKYTTIDSTEYKQSINITTISTEMKEGQVNGNQSTIPKKNPDSNMRSSKSIMIFDIDVQIFFCVNKFCP